MLNFKNKIESVWTLVILTKKMGTLQHKLMFEITQVRFPLRNLKNLIYIKKFNTSMKYGNFKKF